MAFVRKALSFRHRGRYNVQDAKENRFPKRSSYRQMNAELEEEGCQEKAKKGGAEKVGPSTSTAPELKRQNKSDSSLANAKVAKVLRTAMGTIRQKMRSSVRRRKRLNSCSNTPASTLRRSLRLKNRTPREPNVMESPQSVRLNKFQPKRCNFSPGQFNRDLDTVSKGIKTLSNISVEMDKTIERQNR